MLSIGITARDDNYNNRQRHDKTNDPNKYPPCDKIRDLRISIQNNKTGRQNIVTPSFSDNDNNKRRSLEEPYDRQDEYRGLRTKKA
mmetsp:Transcript_23573/g.44849  ORF Transcript_23573/g.44849 Transcript_23573/m.44849 type:complete len:86 (-) Transcript_23573:4021-4278(-)|eukprot:scaffold10570_cov176-Amphora_coffeaeformis.AAC.18